MKRNIYNKLTTICIVLTLHSCGLPYCKKIPFESEDLVWVSPYEKGDMLIFKTKLGKLDTIIVTNKYINNPSNTFIFDLRGCNCWEADNEFKANAGFVFAFRKKEYQQMTNEPIEGYFGIEKTDKKVAAKPDFTFGELYSRENTIFKDTSILISKKRIDDCIVLHRNECNIIESYPIIGVLSFVWSKKYGLVEYSFETGEKYEYFKKLRIKALQKN